MKKFIYLLLTLLLVVPAFSSVIAQDEDEAVDARLTQYNVMLPQGYGLISAEDLSTMIAEQPETILLDVREVDEYTAGHLENAFNVPIRTLGQNLNLLPDLGAQIVVICKGGGRATQAATALGLLGYTNVRILKGGYGAWEAAELPTTTDEFTVEAGTAPEFDEVIFTAVNSFLTNLPEGFGFVTAQNLVTELTAENAPILIDVRALDEYNQGYIGEAPLHIWINQFMMSKELWPAEKDANIVIYCASGYRGSIAYVMMVMSGYTNVRSLAGGSNAWLSAGFPLNGVPEVDPAIEIVNARLMAYNVMLPQGYGLIDVEALNTMITEQPETVLLDVREIDEYTAGHLENAFNVPLRTLAQNLNLLPDLNAQIVVICKGGGRATLGATALGLLGYTNVRILKGGYGAWEAEELPTTTEAYTVEAGTAPEFEEAVLAAVDAYLSTLPEGFAFVTSQNLVTELITAENAPVLFDVRALDEYTAGTIDGATHIWINEFMMHTDLWPEDKDANIVLFCASGYRGAIGMMLMEIYGYTNVRSLAGGTNAWVAAGFPLVVPEPAS